MRYEMAADAIHHVHFSGPWTEAERRKIIVATSQFDDEHSPIEDHPFGRPWVAVRHNLDDGPVLLLTRLGVPHAFYATSIEDMVTALNRHPRRD